MKGLFRLLPLITLSILTACSGYSEEELALFDQEIQKYLKEKEIEDAVRTESGLYYRIIEEGDGPEIPYDAIISVNYKGYLTNGRPFDSQLGNPVDLDLKRLVTGWREAMLYMHVGTKAQLFIPPDLGYGQQEKSEIPAHSILIFDLEIHDVK